MGTSSNGTGRISSFAIWAGKKMCRAVLPPTVTLMGLALGLCATQTVEKMATMIPPVCRWHPYLGRVPLPRAKCAPS